MSESEWLLNQILLHLGGADIVVKHLPNELLEKALKVPSFNMFAPTELAMILSYTDLKDTKSIMLTCKKWYEATQRVHFWKQRIEVAKRKIGGKLFQLFDTFKSPVQETLRDQVEWLFRRRSWILVRSRSIVRRSRDHCIDQYFEGSNVSSHCWFEPDSQTSFSTKKGKYVRVNIREKGLIKIEKEKYDDKKAVVKKILDDDSIYEGEAEEMDSKKKVWTPHGDGKWIFPDGTILEGKGIAWKGEPRQPVQKKIKLDSSYLVFLHINIYHNCTFVNHMWFHCAYIFMTAAFYPSGSITYAPVW